MCGTGEKWSVEALTDTIKFDHGYTATSTAIGFFLDILTELDAADQRRFLRFVTGSPRLPPGGIAALHPRCAPANALVLPHFVVVEHATYLNHNSYKAFQLIVGQVPTTPKSELS